MNNSNIQKQKQAEQGNLIIINYYISNKKVLQRGFVDLTAFGETIREHVMGKYGAVMTEQGQKNAEEEIKALEEVAKTSNVICVVTRNYRKKMTHNAIPMTLDKMNSL